MNENENLNVTQTRRQELKFVLFAMTAFGFFSLSGYSAGIGIIGIGFLILAYVDLRNLQRAEKPNAIQSSITYAGFWVRFGSLVIDMGLYGLLFLPVHFFLRGNPSRTLINNGLYLCCLVIFLYMVKRWGQSPGKMAMGIKIVKTDLSPLGWKEVLLRGWVDIFVEIRAFAEYLLIFLGVLTTGLVLTGAEDPSGFSSQFVKIIHDRFVTFDTLWLLSEPFVLLTNQRNRALHDYLAGTVVVLEKKKNKFKKYSGALVLLSLLIMTAFIYVGKRDYFTDQLIEARQGPPKTQRFLAMDYYYGTDVAKSYPDAFLWFEKAAEGGDAKAQEYLGIMYEKGESVKPDRAEAIKWYKLSWKNGDYHARDALFRLGERVDPNP